MNDKIYCCITNAETSYRWTNIYETTATGATRYMQVYNDAANNASPDNDQMRIMVHPQHGTDSFQWSKLVQYQWEGANGNGYQGTTALRHYVVTKKPETSKTSLGANFTGVTSADWTGAAPTMTLNSEKQTGTIPTWSVLDTDGTVGSNGATGWDYNMMRKTFLNGNVS